MPSTNEFNNEIVNLSSTMQFISKILDSISKHDLSQRIDNKSNNESEIVISLKKMNKNLIEMVSNIMVYSNQLGASSKNMDKISSNVLDRANQIDSNAGKVSDATEQMSENMDTIAAAAEELSTNMNSVSDRAADSSHNILTISSAVEEMSATIQEIATHSAKARTIVEHAVTSLRNVSKRVDELQKASQGINYVTDTISDISDQTNLLALNATIEAARAGEAGIRFAVVANEVKSLSSETNDATKDIQEKVETMEQAAENTRSEINTIDHVIEEVNEIITTIATAVEEQSATVSEISSNISYAANGVSDVAAIVMEANIAVQEVTKNITEAAGFTNVIVDELHGLKSETSNLKSESSVLFANAMEVSGRSESLELLVNTFKLPNTYRVSRNEHRDLFEFTKKFSVKINEIDHEHKGIFDYMNKIHSAIKNSRPSAELMKLLKDLYTWTDNHFAHEEKLMMSINYIDFDIHVKSHKDLLGNVRAIIEKIESGEEVNLIKVLIFLKEWLIKHILGMDQKYSQPLNDNGIF
jgi:methyl-accepting chemotaxis protein